MLAGPCNSDPLEPIQECTLEPRHEKTDILFSDLVRHKPGCRATEDG